MYLTPYVDMLVFFILLVTANFTVIPDDTHSFKGRVIGNDMYKSPLHGASVYFPDLEKGAITNLSGYFSFDEIPQGTHRLRISFVGYKTKEVLIDIPANKEIFMLESDPQELEELEVTAEAEESMQVQQASLSTINVTALPLSNLPRLMGEPDLIRIIQNLPGVKTESDFTGGFHVRGGRNDQNLILLDGVPVYNPWHLFGLFSAFNTEAIDNVELTKGVFPAKYGSRVSSVLDIDLQRGSERLGAGYLTVSPLSGSFSYGRPLNQKTSYLISLRRTYMDPVFWVLNKTLSTENEWEKETHSNGYNFFDVNLKIVHQFNPRLKLEAAYFRSSDQFGSGFKTVQKGQNNETWRDDINVGWRNNTSSLKLRYRTSRFASETQSFLTFYTSDNLLLYDGQNLNDRSDNNLYVITAEREEQRFDQQFRDFGLTQNLTVFSNGDHSFHFGAFWQLHNFRDVSTYKETEEGYLINPDSGSLPPSERLVTRLEGDSLTTYAHEIGTYFSANLHAGNFSFYPGIRYEYYAAGDYHILMPRFNASWEITPSFEATAGYGYFSQYIHVLGLDLLRAPTDRWFWSDEERLPLRTRMATLGFGFDFKELGEVSVEGYYKNTENLLNFDLQNQLESLRENEMLPRFGSETVAGSGEAYGVELFWGKNRGKITGWLGYTVSWTWNRFESLNNGNRFPARTDKRHDLQAFLNWDFGENWSLGILFNYKSGQPVTFSIGHYLVESDPLQIGERQGGNSQVIKKMNNFRLPAYHRLDLNVTWKNRQLFNKKTEFTLNVVNIYNNHNVLTVTTSTEISELPDRSIQIRPNNKYIGQLPVLPVFSMRVFLGGDSGE